MNETPLINGWDRIESVIVTGAQGMLGRAVVAALDRSEWLQNKEKKSCLHSCDIDELDITDAKSVANYLESRRPQLLINCAAYTEVDVCESNRARAFAVNGDGPLHLARSCLSYGCKMVHISSDFVFDGRRDRPYLTDDTVNPLSVYGRSKLAGEQAVQNNLSEYLIVRTAWLFGAGGKNFVTTIRRLAQEQDFLEVVSDQIGSPTYTVDLAEALGHLVRSEAKGIFHFVNEGRCSWFEFAREIVKQSGWSTEVRPVNSEQLKRPAHRPAFSVLDTAKFQKTTGHTIRPWQVALAEYIGNL